MSTPSRWSWWRRDRRLELGGTSRIGRSAVRRSRVGVLLAVALLAGVGVAVGYRQLSADAPPPRLGTEDGMRVQRLPLASGEVLHDDDRIRLGQAVAWYGALADGRPTTGMMPPAEDARLRQRAQALVAAQPLLQSGQTDASVPVVQAAAAPLAHGGLSSNGGFHVLQQSGVWARIDHDPWLGPRDLELRNPPGADYIVRLSGPGAATVQVDGMPLVPGRNYLLGAGMRFDAPEPCTVLLRPRTPQQRIHGLAPMVDG
jgi:hypothetical protein